MSQLTISPPPHPFPPLLSLRLLPFLKVSSYPVHVNLEFTVLLHQPPKWWDYRCALPHLVKYYLKNIKSAQYSILRNWKRNQKRCYFQRKDKMSGFFFLKFFLVIHYHVPDQPQALWLVFHGSMDQELRKDLVSGYYSASTSSWPGSGQNWGWPDICFHDVPGTLFLSQRGMVQGPS